MAVQNNCTSIQDMSYKLKKDKEIILIEVKNDILECYKTFEEIVEKEGEEFLFSCWNNEEWQTRLQVANHPNFLPTLEQIEIGLKNWHGEVKEIYQLRQDEWLAKIEENKLW